MIVQKVVSYVSVKAKTRVSIDKLFLTFRGDLYLEGLYIEDQQGDTLLYSNSLETGLKILPFLTSGAVHLSRVNWRGLRAQIKRNEQGVFNFDFLVESFSSPPDSLVTPPDSAEISGEDTVPLPDVALGPVRLEDFSVRYMDAILGAELDLRLGAFRLAANSLDLNRMDFDVEELVWSDSDIRYLQRSPFPSSSDSSDVSLEPAFILDKLALENIALSYVSLPDDIEAEIVLGKMNLAIPEADLGSGRFELSQFLLHNSHLDVGLFSESAEQLVDEESDHGGSFQWPSWQVAVGTIDLEDNRIAYRTKEVTPQAGYFDPGYVVVDNLNFKADGISIADQHFEATVSEASFEERSGLVLQKLALRAEIDDQATNITSVQLQTGNSQLAGDFGLQYRISGIVDELVWERLTLAVPKLRIGLSDAFFFLPELRANELFRQASERELSGSLNLSGTPDRLRISDGRAAWGEDTHFRLQGNLGNLLGSDDISFQLSSVSFSTTGTDVRQFVSEEQLGVKPPEQINIESSLSGSLADLSVECLLQTSDGDVQLTARFEDGTEPHYEGELFLDGIALGSLLESPQYGYLGYRLRLQGSGLDLDELELSLHSEFERLEVNGYDYKGLKLDAELADKQGDFSLVFADKNLDLALDGEVVLDSENTMLDLVLDLKGADFRALQLAKNDLRARISYSLHMEGNADGFSLDSELNDGVLVFEGQSYPVEAFDVSAFVEPDSTFLQIESSLLGVAFASNASPDRTIEAFNNYFEQLFADTADDSSPDSMINFTFSADVGRSRILQEVVFPGLENWESLNTKVNFDQQSGDFRGYVFLPGFTYSGISMDSLGVYAEGTEDSFLFQAGLVSLKSGTVEIGKTFFDGKWGRDQLNLDFLAYDGEDRLVHVGWNMRVKDDSIQLHIRPSDLILNKQPWEIHPDNVLKYGGGKVDFHQFELSRDNQYLELFSDSTDISSDHVGVRFNNFRLATFSRFLNPDNLIAAGFVNGSFVLENPFKAAGILAALRIDELHVFNTPLGNLELGAESIDVGAYDFEMSLKDRGVDVDLVGDYQAAEQGAQLNLALNLKELRLGVLESLFPDQISGSSGVIVGSASVSGTTVDPIYEGEFGFLDAAVTVTSLNAAYRIHDQSMKIDNSGLYLDRFTIRDANENRFALAGSIGTESLSNPEFDLHLTAENFQVLNSSRQDNDLFFGKAIIDVNADINGDLSLPKIAARLKVRSGTDVTFIIPESQLDVIERDGVVLFVNRQDPEDLLTRRQQEVPSTGITGFQVTALLEADSDASFRIIVDERSGDNLLVAGEANLNLNVDPNGRISLSGIYQLSTGHYEMSLYNLVSRRFVIEEGSSISWSGDPLDAKLNMVAIYRVRASAAELMAAQTAGLGAEAQSQYKQELPFLVYLNIDGDLTQLEPSFRLDMPEDQRGAAGGNVYGQLQLLNTQEGELNRQVFSLLVLNRFFPDRGGDGTIGSTFALARSSVSQLLSGQLNTLSENVLGDTGLELDFDLDSFTDYQSGAARDRTQLNVSARSRFMNDRLVVQVGSQIDIEGSSQALDRGNALLGNVSIEYLLTESGRYRLRGFRRNQFESFIDGQLIVTGISLIFNREFNHFEELWRGIENKRRSQSDAIRKGESMGKSTQVP
ncbi:translocation/assembly module TamB domain-containing protein [Lunatimonas salinarum]|uniref:translocation/assembly module TamB domain-containing protein n=1 Tax=Lunatimonas salinarum TaxID=1774590 RepID=UPI001AE0A371|nr:translocation/assembly module TamB domain-containing protein [Lunatimonas salinarum]